ncbi:MAG: SDR family oxidoreductase [bacterium]
MSERRDTGEQRVVLITGVLGGIGGATARLFGDEGWHVVGVDVDRPDGEGTGGVDRLLTLDIADPGAVTELMGSVQSEEGRLDALVNNAAIQVNRALDEMTLEDWDRTMEINLRAPFWCIRRALPLLKDSKGAVVNVSSVHAEATSRRISAYAASKGALSALTRALAVELAGEGIRINAVMPGAVDTPMLWEGLARGHSGEGSTEERLRRFSRKHCLGRIAQPEEVAQAILFLADDERSSYITGENLLVDGGVTVALRTE